MIPNKDLIEDRFMKSIERYVNDGCPTGGFLDAVLCNDLKEAVGRADSEALENLPHIVAYLYNDVPGMCWGSKEKVANWYKHKNVTA